MNVKKLIDLINIFEANVIFDNPKDSIEQGLGERHPWRRFLRVPS